MILVQVRVAGPPEAFRNFIVVANKGPHDDEVAIYLSALKVHHANIKTGADSQQHILVA